MKSRDKNSSKEIIGLLVKKVSKGSASYAVKFEGSTWNFTFFFSEFHGYIQDDSYLWFHSTDQTKWKKTKTNNAAFWDISPLGMVILMQFSLAVQN